MEIIHLSCSHLKRAAVKTRIQCENKLENILMLDVRSGNSCGKKEVKDITVLAEEI